MQNFKLNKSAVALAIAGAFTAGAANATALTVGAGAAKLHPSVSAAGVFSNGLKARLVAALTGGAAAGNLTATVYFYDATTTSVGNVVLGTDATADATLDIQAAAGLVIPPSATRAVIVVSSTVADTLDGQADAYVAANGALVGVAGGAAAAAAAAIGLGTPAVFPVNNTYKGPIVTAVAKTAQTSADVTFNTEVLVGAGGNISNALQLVQITNGQTSGDAVFAGSKATANTAVPATGEKTVVIAPNNKVAGGTPGANDPTEFVAAYNKLTLAADASLTDVATNPAYAETVYAVAAVDHDIKPALASGKAAVLNDTTTDLKVLWNNDITNPADYTGQTATVTLRLKEGVSLTNGNLVGAANAGAHVAQDGSTNATPLLLAVEPKELVVNAVAANRGVDSVAASGTDVVVTLDLAKLAANYGAGTRFGVDAATGNLIVSKDDFKTKTPVTVGLAYDGTAILSSAHDTTKAFVSGDAIAQQNVVLGTVPSVIRSTLDKDINGWLDGFTIDTQGPALANGATALTGTGELTGTGLSLVTTAAAQLKDQKALASKVYANGATKVQVSLDNPSASFDWDADGTPSTGDTTAWKQANFATDRGFAGKALQFQAVSTTQSAATVSTLTYDQAYRATDGGKLPLVNELASGGKYVVVDDPDQDGAAPVIISASLGTLTKDAGNAKLFGDVTLKLSEPVNGTPALGEFYIEGKSATLWNLDANLKLAPNAYQSNADEVTLENLPSTVDGKPVTLAFAGASKVVDNASGTGAPADLDLVALGGVSGSTSIATVPDETLKITDAKINEALTYVAGTPINSIVLTLSKTDAKLDDATLTNVKDGMFKVKAVVGARQASGIEIYDFVLPGAAVQLNTPSNGKITLLLATGAVGNMKPISLPGNTTALVVEYDETLAGKGKIVRTADVTQKIANDGSFKNNNTLASFQASDLNGNGEVSAVADFNDDDTRVVSDLTALKLATSDASNTGNFFTMTVRGAAKDGANNLPVETGVRADLVKVGVTAAYEAKPAVAGVAGNGSVAVARDLLDNTGVADNGNGVEIALLNKAITVADLTAVAQAKAKFGADLKAYRKALVEGAANAATLKTALLAQANDAAVKFGATLSNTAATQADGSVSADTILNFNSVSFPAYIEVSTGAGGKGAGSTSAQNGEASDNNDASVGRTATLLKTLPNTVKNGTTTYAVTVGVNGSISQATSGAGGTTTIKGGQIALKLPVLAEAATAGTPVLKVLDTAFGLVSATGTYQLAVGAEEKALNAASSTVDSAVGNEAFVLVSVRNPKTGDWTLINSAEQSFANYLPFQADLKGAGKSNKLDADVSLVSSFEADLNGSWQLKGFTGQPNRTAANAAKAVDLSRLFIGVTKNEGRVTTAWGYDSDAAEVAFSLNGNSAALAYQLGSVSKSNLGLTSGLGLALKNDAAYKAAVDGAASVSTAAVSGDAIVSVPLSSATLNTVALKTGWSLVTAQKKETLQAFLTRNGAVEAALIPNGSSAVTWFKDANVAADAALVDLAKGDALFVYVKQTTTAPVSLTLQ